MVLPTYRGRFAPSPTGLLHIGSLVTAVASWLDAKAVNGTWIVRMEDIDQLRCEKDAAQGILEQLSLFGLISDEPVLYQSARTDFYQAHLERLQNNGITYFCNCSRKRIESHYHQLGRNHLPHQEIVYPGFCRDIPVLQNATGAVRIKITPDTKIDDQLLEKDVGDFVLQRADGVFSYQLAVVVDDYLQGITDIVRGADLASNTPRQKWLQQLLGFSTPKYLHIPIVVDEFGNKLSKQTLAKPLWPSSRQEILEHLSFVADHLQLNLSANTATKTVNEWQEQAIRAWRQQKKNFLPRT